MTENCITLQLILDFAIAVGTISLAVIAIYGEQIKKWVAKPNVKVFISHEEPYIAIEEDRNDSESSKTYTCNIKLKVMNISNTVANNSRGLIQIIWHKRRSNDSFYKFREITPTQLYWHDERATISLSSQLPEYLQIALIKRSVPSLTEEENLEAESNPELYLALPESKTKGELLKLGKGTFIIPVIICSDNLRVPITYYVELFWDGEEVQNIKESEFYAKILQKKDLPHGIK